MIRIKTVLVSATLACAALTSSAQTGNELPFQSWALTPPMGWNSWDCYGPTVVESEVKANADYMAAHLLDYGWEYVVVDIRWFVENDKAGGYNQTNPIYVIDQYGRYTPALNRFPSAANGVGFRALADYVHEKGLRFGIHLMRGVPKQAVEKKLPVKGTNGITCDMIANSDSTCTWLRDNMKVDWRKPGAQEYYNSCFEMYADWGVDFVKIDDLSRPYHTAEIEMIRNAIDNCGRPIVLSISPGETPVERVEHVKTHANMWRTVDDFWDNWSQLNYQFQICAKWAPYIAPGTWPDADMLPLGKISIRGERGAERWTNFTADEQYTMMNLWTIFKSPLMFGGDLPQNDDATNALLTNRDVLYMHHYSAANRQLDRSLDDIVTWTADDPANGDKFVALFNLGGDSYVNSRDALYRSGTISYLTTGHATDVDVALPEGTRQLALVVTDGGDGFDSDHADWINPRVEMADGSVIDLTTLSYVKGTCGWGSIHVNSNIEGGKLSVNGTTYDNGFAVHANSILLFNLPGEACRFTAFAGIDNTGSNQGSKSSVEFMVFDYDATQIDPSADLSADATLDLVKLGFAEGQNCNVTEMWSGKLLGQFSDAGFTVRLNPHASGLYRVSAVERSAGASVSISVPDGELNSATPFEVSISVSGGDADGAYIQLLDNDKVIGTLPLDGSNSVTYRALLSAGSHVLKARYSGTTTVDCAVSPEVVVGVAAAPEDLTPLRKRLASLLDEARDIDPMSIAGALRGSLSDVIASIEALGDINLLTREQLEENIANLREVLDNARMSMAAVNALRGVMADCEAFAAQLRDGDEKNALVTGVANAAEAIASATTTVEDLTEAATELQSILDEARKTGQPVEGGYIDVTDRIVNPSFELSTTGWSSANNYGGWQDVSTWSDRPAADGSSFISVAGGTITSLDLYQTIGNLPEGRYRLEASLRNTDGVDWITDQRLYARVGTSTLYSDPLITVSGDNNNDWTRLSIDGIEVVDGKALRIGACSTGDGATNHGWFHADDFRLYYYGKSGILDLPSAQQGITVTVIPAGVEIVSDRDAVLPVYMTNGALVENVSLTSGTTQITLAPGFYIVNSTVVLVK